jgi:flagellar biogenesis protein FliO
MRKRESVRVTARQAASGILVEVAFVAGAMLIAALIALFVAWGVR